MGSPPPWGKYRVERGVPHTVVAHAGANVRRRCYLIVTDAMLADRQGPRRYWWLDADTGAEFDARPGEAMVTPTAGADRYAMDLDSFAEEAFTAAGWQPEPCTDRLCSVNGPHHHLMTRIVGLNGGSGGAGGRRMVGGAGGAGGAGGRGRVTTA